MHETLALDGSVHQGKGNITVDFSAEQNLMENYKLFSAFLAKRRSPDWPLPTFDEFRTSIRSVMTEQERQKAPIFWETYDPMVPPISRFSGNPERPRRAA